MCPASLPLVLLLALPTSHIPFDNPAPMYVVDSSRRLLTVNVLTGETDLIGSTEAQLTDIAFGHDGQLYGVNARYLYGIDPETGGTTLIGNHGYGEFGAGFGIDSLTFGYDGVLYAAGDDILISIDPQTGDKCLGSIEEQTERVLKNLFAILDAAGSAPSRVIKTTVYVSDISLWDRVNAVYSKMFGEHRPARAVVPTKDLHFGFFVEIEAVAAVNE